MNFNPETEMNEYIKGFDAGCNYIVTEIERYIKRHDYEPRIIGPLLTLLAHLKAEGTAHAIRENP